MGFMTNYLGNLGRIWSGRQPLRPLLFSCYVTHRCDLGVTDDIQAVRQQLWRVADTQECAQCWTSCRGFAESMQMRPRLQQYREFLHSVRPHG